MLERAEITTSDGNFLPIGQGVSEVSICCHSDTPVRHILSFVHKMNLTSLPGSCSDCSAGEVDGGQE
jgi:hypothetical protein